MNLLSKLTVLIAAIFTVVSVYGEVWTYSEPGSPVNSSPYFKVRVSQEAKSYDSFVYFSKATFKDTSRTSSWTTFSFDGKINIEIEVFGESISSCIIRPKSKGISHRIKDDRIILELEKPTKFAVEINNNKKKPLFVFADAPEENVPSETAPGTWFFKPGVHDIGKMEIPDSVQHI
jgi:hypothetical protein